MIGAMASLHETAKRMLASETFEPRELADVLVQQGHSRADVDAAIAAARAEIDETKRRPAVQEASRRRRRGARFIQLGVLILAVGLAFTVFVGGGTLQLLLIIAVGGAFLGAGARSMGS